MSEQHLTRHGHTKGNKTTSEYNSWRGMVDRCTNPKTGNYQRYGGRGITVCIRWLKFANFLEDMGLKPTPQHTIERIKNYIGYEPLNCRWATQQEQCRNTRRNHYITWDGRTLCRRDWEKTLGFRRGLLTLRLRSGWTEERALSTPVQFHKSG